MKGIKTSKKQFKKISQKDIHFQNESIQKVLSAVNIKSNPMNTSLWNFRPMVIKVVKVSKDTNKIIVNNYQRWNTGNPNNWISQQQCGKPRKWTRILQILKALHWDKVRRQRSHGDQSPSSDPFFDNVQKRFCCLKPLRFDLPKPSEWVSKCAPPINSNSISITWDLVINSNSQSHPRPHEAEEQVLYQKKQCGIF